jgi:hypothetical protein
MDLNWLKPGSLIRVNHYEFDDDGSKRDKYMVVLYHDAQQALIIDSLTTSKSKGASGTNFGCSIHNNLIPYFLFPANHVIGKDNYFFDLDTYIFFKDNIRMEPISKFDKQVALSIFGIAKLDELSNADLKRLIKCALKSKFVPIGIANILAAFKATL